MANQTASRSAASRQGQNIPARSPAPVASTPASSTPAATPAAPAAAAPSVPAVAAPAAPAPAAAVPAVLPKFTVKKQVIMPALNLQTGTPRILVVTGAMYQSSYVDPDPKKAKEKPATLMPVGDVQSGESFNLLVPAVLEANIKEAYPQDSYVQKVFYMEKLPKRPGKRYFDFKLFEVELEKTPS